MNKDSSITEFNKQDNKKTIKVYDKFINLSESSWVVLDSPEIVDYEIKIELKKELIAEPEEIMEIELSTPEPENKLYAEMKESKNKPDELTDKTRKSLLSWYTKRIDSATKICENIQDSTDPELDHYKNCIKNFPKCIVRSIRQVCKCNEDCLSEFKIHEKFKFCNLYDNSTNIYDNEYVECCWPFIYITGNMKYINHGDNLENSAKKFHKEIEALCQNTDKYNTTKCALYDLQDECLNEAICIERRFAHILEQKCENFDFDDLVNELQEIVKFSVLKFKERPLRFAKREISNQELINLISDSLDSTVFDVQHICPAILIVFFICLIGGLHFIFGSSKKQSLALIMSGLFFLIGYLLIF